MVGVGTIARVFFSSLGCLAISLSSPMVARAANGPGTFSYEGRLYDSGGNPSTQTVRLTLGVYNPAKNCLLRLEQTAPIDLSLSSGYFSVTVGQGAAVIAPDPGLSMTTVFANRGTITGASCSYTPMASDGRVLRISVNDGVNNVTLTPDIEIGASPFAIAADTADNLQGKAAADFLQVNSSTAQLTQANLESLLGTSAKVAELNALAAGSSTKYAPVSTTAGVAVPTVAGAPAAPIAGSMWYDTGTNQLKYYDGSSVQTLGAGGGGGSGTVTSVAAGPGLSGGTITTSGTISMPNVGTIGTYYKVTTDAQGRVSSGVSALVEADIPTLATAGKVNGTAINSGTIGGSTAINTTGAIQTSGGLSANTSSANLFRAFEGTNTYHVALAAPASLSSTYNLFLPMNLPGTNGMILASDTAGNLSWVSPGGGGSYISTAGGTMTGALTISAGGANISGGLNLNSAGITNTGPLTGVGANISGVGALMISAGGAAQDLTLNSSTTGSVNIGTGNGTGLRVLDSGITSMNYMEVKGAGSGMAPVIATAGSDPNIDLKLAPKGLGQVLIPNGNVGIGTTSPAAYRLEVQATSGSAIFGSSATANGVYGMSSSSSSAGVYGSNFSSGPAVYGYQGSAGPGVVAHSVTGPPLVAWATGGATEVFRVANDGNVGVGTSAPLYNLHVFDSVDDAVAGVEAADPMDQAKLLLSNSGMGKHWALANKGSSYNGNFVISDGGIERFLIDGPSGYVGIGTTVPSSSLTVQGTIESKAGGFRFPDGSVQATASNPLPPPRMTNIAWTAGSVSPNSTMSQNVAVTGAAVGDGVICNPRAILPVGASFYCFVTTPNTVTLVIANSTGTLLSSLGSINWDFVVIK